MYPQAEHSYQRPQPPSPRLNIHYGKVTFFPVAPYIFRTATRQEHWTSEVSSCSIGPFDASKPSQTTCYALIKAVSEDSRFTIHRAAREESSTIQWHVPGYWLVTSRHGPWAKLFEFGCFIMEIAVPSDGSDV